MALIKLILSTSPCGLSDMDIIGGSIAGALKVVGIYHGFDQQGSHSIQFRPIQQDLCFCNGLYMTCKVLNLDPREDQKPAITDDAL